MPAPMCVCGHQKEAHEHFRRGTDCGVCGAEVCPRFRKSRRSAGSTGTPPGSAPSTGATPERDTERLQDRAATRAFRRPTTT